MKPNFFYDYLVNLTFGGSRKEGVIIKSVNFMQKRHNMQTRQGQPSS